MACLRFALRSVVFGLLALQGVAAQANPIVINELVTDPKSDWDDSTGAAGDPFDGTPGPGVSPTPGPNDEYIELKNVSASTQSLIGYTLEMNDSTPAADLFDPNAPSNQHAQYYRVFDANGARVSGDPLNAVPAGGYVVLGNPAGDLAHTQAMTLNLKDGSSLIVDTVSFPASATDANGTVDEAFSRFPDGSDTNSGATDFLKRGSTLGRANGTYCDLTTGDAVVNEAVGDPLTDWDGSSTVDSELDEYIELKNTSALTLSFVGCALDMVDTSPASFLFLETDSGSTTRVEVHDPNGTLLGTAPALASVPPGGYVLLFDPPGQMNSTGTTSLILRAGPSGLNTIDSVDVGLDASSDQDEAQSRFPDGTGDPVGRAGTPGRSNGSGSFGTPGLQVINEVVIEPFEDRNGDGSITLSDQAIELLNKSDQTLDLTGWTVTMLDTTPVVRPITNFGLVIFSAGGSIEAWKPNEYIELVGLGGQMNTDVFLRLTDFQGNTIDTVEIGGNKTSTDYQGDGSGNGAPGGGANGAAFGIGDSAIARVPNGTDTNNDILDFQAQAPTLGASNDGPGGDVTAPALDAANTTSGNNFPVSASPRLSFSEAIDPDVIGDELVALRRVGALPNEAPVSQSLSLLAQDRAVSITPRAVLRYSTVYEIVAFSGITDRAGNAFPVADPNGVVFATFTTEAAPTENQAAVRINEVVVDPQRDWKAQGFKQLAPQGNNTSLDEWVELYNAGAGPVDLSSYTFNMIDSARNSIQIGQAIRDWTLVCFDSGAQEIVSPTCFQSLPAGGYLIIGDPPGSLSNDVYLELRNETGVLVDTIEIGGSTSSTDYGGDGAGNGAPAGTDGDALGLFDESVARVPNGADSGNELIDWKKQRPTLGRANDLVYPVDTTPPTVVSATLSRTVPGGAATVDTDIDLVFNEPMDLATINSETVTLRGTTERVALEFEYSQEDQRVRVHWTGILTFGASYTFRVRGNLVGVRDQSRNPDQNRGIPMAQDFTFSFTAEPLPSPSTTLLVNEVVADPQRDWNDSLLGPGQPFDAQVGLNIATTADEWIEIYNRGPRSDLAGYRVVMKDSDYAQHLIGTPGDATERYSGDGGAGSIAGLGYLVIGDPSASMNDTVFVGIRNPSGVLIDGVQVLEGAGSTEDEAFARFPNGSDTNVDITDFTPFRPSILAPNNPGGTPPKSAQPLDVLFTEFTVDPQNDWDDSGGATGLPFDGNPGPLNSNPTTSDEYIELANVSGKTLKLTGWTVAIVDSSPAFYTLGSDPGIEFYRCSPPRCSGTPSAENFPPQAILVLGNPPGSMNNDVFLELRDLTGLRIDKVELGGNSPSTNYEADDDQDGSVDEDRKDNEDDDGDGAIDEDLVNPDEPTGDGIPRNGDGNADRPGNQAFHRINTTGIDQDDWTRGQGGTPGTEPLDSLLKQVVNSHLSPVLAGLSVLLVAFGIGVRSRRSRPLPSLALANRKKA